MMMVQTDMAAEFIIKFLSKKTAGEPIKQGSLCHTCEKINL